MYYISPSPLQVLSYPLPVLELIAEFSYIHSAILDTSAPYKYLHETVLSFYIGKNIKKTGKIICQRK